MNGLNFSELEERYIELIQQKEEIEQEIASIKDRIMTEAEITGQSSFLGEKFEYKYIPETVVRKFDSTAFGAANPEEYALYVRESKRKGYIQIKEKKQPVYDDAFAGLTPR